MSTSLQITTPTRDAVVHPLHPDRTGTLAVTADAWGVVHARRWVVVRARLLGAPPATLLRLRLLAVVLLRDAAGGAREGSVLHVGLDVHGRTVRLTVEDPASRVLPSPRALRALRRADVWGVERVGVPGRRVWCELEPDS